MTRHEIHRSRWARPATLLLGALLLGAALAGCQPLNHPFEPGEKSADNPLLQLREGLGVTVMPVTGVPPTFAERLSEALAGALRDADIPAAVGTGNRGSVIVMGAARLDAGAPEQELEIEWNVAAPGGRLLGNVSQREHVTLASAAGPVPGQLAAIAKRGVALIAPLVRDDMPAERPAAAILIGTIDGAPGDGAASLKRALEFVLRQSGIPVAGADHVNALTVVASIETGRPAGGQQTVAIRWVLLQPDGSEIGDVRQENAVPAGSLDRAWGETALLVAEAAYDGIVALYEKASGNIAQ
jgi:hypothetical protein